MQDSTSLRKRLRSTRSRDYRISISAERIEALFLEFGFRFTYR